MMLRRVPWIAVLLGVSAILVLAGSALALSIQPLNCAQGQQGNVLAEVGPGGAYAQCFGTEVSTGQPVESNKTGNWCPSASGCNYVLTCAANWNVRWNYAVIDSDSTEVVLAAWCSMPPDGVTPMGDALPETENAVAAMAEMTPKN